MTRLQWSALAKVTALAGLTPEQATQAVIDEGRAALVAAIGRHRPDSHGPEGAERGAVRRCRPPCSTSACSTPRPARPTATARPSGPPQWASTAPRLASTLTGYIDQVRLSLRPSTMVRVEGVLREFACWLAATAPEVACVADLRRRHIEAYKLHLAARPSARGGTLTKTSLAEHLGGLRTCFERLTEWDGDDVPGRGAGLRRRPAAARRTAAPLPRRRRVHQAAAGHPRRPRPVRAPGRGVPGPHRPAQGRVLGPHRRLRRADRRRLLAARARRQAPLRPLHPAAPTAQRPPRRLARRSARQPAQPLPVRRARPTHRPGPRRPGRRQSRRRPPGSATSARTACVTRWPPRRSTGACRSRR